MFWNWSKKQLKIFCLFLQKVFDMKMCYHLVNLYNELEMILPKICIFFWTCIEFNIYEIYWGLKFCFIWLINVETNTWTIINKKEVCERTCDLLVTFDFSLDSGYTNEWFQENQSFKCRSYARNGRRSGANVRERRRAHRYSAGNYACLFVLKTHLSKWLLIKGQLCVMD